MISRLEKAKRRIRKHPYTIDITNGCRLAQTCIQENGYVKISFNNRYVYLHRLVAFVHLGLNLYDDKIQVCHKRECPNRHCFNKDHLYLGNATTNAEDFVSTGKHHEASREFCIKGHRLDSIMFTKRDGRVRYCSICRKAAQVKLRNKRKRLSNI